MYAAQPLQLLILSLATSTALAKIITVGIGTSEASRPLHVPVGECTDVDEEEVYTLDLKQPCRVFTADGIAPSRRTYERTPSAGRKSPV
ncbi:uncharacterized protein BDW47DRAFT_122158 [Aspergillus candidus]|uniref:Uncharacterized protein n=1 Tax=Aspergillus candidus TaxID=41067 RepID=A0A2I2FM46_ASPCN|nr:hypothetical protein BDW47DRAFT_122158 [Aspergillus candidus]PLB41699.1 hypothetical protein BDW47DRAFT_122158 [Aspergillus candidus]